MIDIIKDQADKRARDLTRDEKVEVDKLPDYMRQWCYDQALRDIKEVE